ncbi:sulfotransferase domain-containing protein [Sinorhizobium sp. BG8]|uniref:sulfotransferase domain-containing protein n=1 Tax=Sinorhizobium sp. BG8 TaxID=2613773 RepID=UPI00193CC2C4|nr:sulfotransferase domain-containing protein [Sinorhizobium sp. BG8]QRM54551.1 hypothetical protein F3Y30_08325 [Sinorhizobium sp. BG8]
MTAFGTDTDTHIEEQTPKPLRLVMHIGPHKTGTTYMQANFRHRRKSLRRRGWLYPSISVRSALAHHDLSDDGEHLVAREGRSYRDFMLVLEKADREGLNIILSSEGFRKWKPAHFAAVKEIIGTRELDIVYMLRDPYDSFYSWWAQQVKMGMTQSLPEWMSRHFDNPLHSRLLNPVREIRPVFETAGVNYTILLYDELRRKKIDIFEYFLSTVLGIDDLRASKPSNNIRHPIEITEFIRLLSKDSGHPSGKEHTRTKIHIGDVLKLLFNKEEKAEIVNSIRDAAAPAKRTLELERTTPEFLHIERHLIHRYKSIMSPPPEGGQLFSREPARWTYYDEAELRRNPAFVKLLKKGLRKTRPTNPALIITNLKKLIRYHRRSLKKFWRFSGPGAQSSSKG